MDFWISRAKQGAEGVRERLTLTPCDLFPYIRGKTLWMIGDSLTLEWHKAVQCFMYEFWDMKTVELPVAGRENFPKQGWCSFLAQDTQICFLRANTAGEIADLVLPNLPVLGAKTTDLMVLNAAVWHNHYDALLANMTQLAHSFTLRKHMLPMAFWRDAPAQHFATPTGDFEWSQETSDCTEPKDVKLLPNNQLKSPMGTGQDLVEGGWRNRLSLPVIESIGIQIIHTWNETLLMWEYHTHFNPNGGDCTHTCHPSTYQYWVYELYRTFKTTLPGVATLQ